ncbi:prolipoprotein diacylglyceryl transferase [Alloacidobacterium dinghuense]|uniref:Prolipoprotein diacylglyceryl transferase n=1 Tax=Alloacidobacterium dinghuense TaxID=2763107 RepID=A0A7G8BNA6_9BACT|nr:prolipoprotein diacylglyceryl transferase [Alloacidobacterium dinghuense]QNI34026.1 prolipoprotein diacylglyceryl transferase [Alloacidobacterium dinghuense]
MYPFIHIGRFSIGTFGIMLWLAAVAACWVLHRNFRRWKVDADAIGIVAISTVIGVLGAKLWHVLETPQLLVQDPAGMLLDRAGFAWFGGLIAGILALLWQSRGAGLSKLGMLDLAAPAAAVGYGVGRLGCLISGDGDYGIPTNLPWGMSFPNGLVPTTQRVHPTPIYELIAALLIAWILWHRSRPETPRSAGEITGEYLVMTGIARFLIEFIRINPKLYWGMSNAQVAAVGSILAGIALVLLARRTGKAVVPPQPVVESAK